MRANDWNGKDKHTNTIRSKQEKGEFQERGNTENYKKIEENAIEIINDLILGFPRLQCWSSLPSVLSILISLGVLAINSFPYLDSKCLLVLSNVSFHIIDLAK